MTRLQLAAVTENIPLILIISARAISGMSTFEISFVPGKWRWTFLPKERYGDTLSGRGSNIQPSNWEADTLPLHYPRLSEIFVANT